MTLLKPFSAEFQEDPHATYHRMRAQEPVYSASLFGIRFWVLTRYRDVAAALRDPRLSAQASASHLMPRELREGNLFFMDPPEHGRLRSLINKAFLPAMVEALRPQVAELIEETLDAALASERERGHFDIVGDLSAALSLRTSIQLMGLPRSDGPRLRRWTGALTVLLDATQLLPRLPEAYAAAREIDAHVRSIITQRRSSADAERPRDLLDALIEARDQRDVLSEQELTATSIFMMVAGHETMTSALGTGLLALLSRPAEWQRLRADPGLLPSAFEEMLRFEPPAQLMTKTAKEDLEIDGFRIRKGEAVVAVMAAANRDPEYFADPDRFDVGRADNRHLSFGMGPHFCVGAGLARLQGQLLLAGLLRRMPGLQERGGDRRQHGAGAEPYRALVAAHVAHLRDHPEALPLGPAVADQRRADERGQHQEQRPAIGPVVPDEAAEPDQIAVAVDGGIEEASRTQPPAAKRPCAMRTAASRVMPSDARVSMFAVTPSRAMPRTGTA